MERVHYRRTIPSRNNRQDSGYSRQTSSEPITQSETIIMQCIVSAVILVAVLIIGLLDTEPTATLRSGIQNALTGATTLNELTTGLNNFSDQWLGLDVVPVAPVLADPVQQDTVSDIPVIPLPEPQPLSAYDEVSNPQIPGPLVTPGLWD